jgi:hypothetical protein
MTDNELYVQLTYALRSQTPGGHVPTMLVLMRAAADTIDMLRGQIPGELEAGTGEDEDKETPPAATPKKQKPAAVERAPRPTAGKCPATGKRHKYGETHQCACGAPERGYEPKAAPPPPAPAKPPSGQLFTHFKPIGAQNVTCGLVVSTLDKAEMSADLGLIDCPECVGRLRRSGALPEASS